MDLATELAAPEVARDSGKKAGSPFLRNLRRGVLSAVLMAAPGVACSAEPGTITADDAQVNSGEALGEHKGEIKLGFDTLHWNVEGDYPQDFQLRVFADGQQVAEKMVRGGAFELSDNVGVANAKRIDIQAFTLDENRNAADPILITPKPGPEDMLGMPFAVNTDAE